MPRFFSSQTLTASGNDEARVPIHGRGTADLLRTSLALFQPSASTCQPLKPTLAARASTGTVECRTGRRFDDVNVHQRRNASSGILLRCMAGVHPGVRADARSSSVCRCRASISDFPTTPEIAAYGLPRATLRAVDASFRLVTVDDAGGPRVRPQFAPTLSTWSCMFHNPLQPRQTASRMLLTPVPSGHC